MRCTLGRGCRFLGWFLGLLGVGLISLPAYAVLDLELTQGVAAAIPIAVVPFSGGGAAGQAAVSQIIAQDLAHSGEFRVQGPTGLGQNPTTPNQVDVAYWRSQGDDNVVVGSLEAMGGGQYRATVSLVGVYGGQATGRTLFTQSFTAPAESLRAVAHRMSDLIYQQLTGVRGVFSTRVAYIVVQRLGGGHSRYALDVADVDGFHPQTLLVSDEPIMSPAWSPDARKLAYVSFEGKRAAIFVQDVLTGSRMRVSNAPGINGAPAFSPDGRSLALVLSTSGNPNLYLLDLASHHLRPLTSGWSIDTEPVFASDGRSLLFTSNRDGNPQIYRYNLENSAISRVTYSGEYNAKASLSPDGRLMACMHREGGQFYIAVQDVPTGRVDVVSQAGSDESPSLAPNGKMIIYATTSGSQGMLAQVSVDGRIRLLLPAREGSVQEPAWSPFVN